MKKLLLFTFLILGSQSFISCTADALPENASKQTVIADDTGGQSGPLTPPIPKP